MVTIGLCVDGFCVVDGFSDVVEEGFSVVGAKVVVFCVVVMGFSVVVEVGGSVEMIGGSVRAMVVDFRVV